MHANLLNRIGRSSSLLNETQLELDAISNHFSEEATNPASLISMTLGGLAFQGSRAAFLGLGIIRNPLARNVLSYAGAFASEVSVIRTSNQLFSGNNSSLLQNVFNPQSWAGTALDIGFLKLAGFAGSQQNLVLRHALQDFSMVTAHDLGAQFGWAPAESGTFLQKLFHAETTNWTLIAGSALGHTLTGGRIAHLERSLALRAEVQSFTPTHHGNIEPSWNRTFPRMASSTDPSLVPAPIRIKLTPRPDESPTDWAERLVNHTYKNPETHALHVVAQLYDRIRNPATRKHTLETIRQIGEQTRFTPEGENFLVHEYTVEGLEKPLLILSLPTTFMPEAWSETFVAGMAKDHIEHSQERELAVEVGSGTGFVSIAMAKLGMAKSIIATDKNHHAPFIGRLNAAINEVDNITFYTGDLLKGIPETTQADLIVGCLPQMPIEKAAGEISLRDLADYAEKRGVFEDELGLGLNASVIDQAKTRLSARGRLRFMMAQRPGLPIVHDLFATRGFVPNIIHTTFIQQDPTTDFHALARIEAEKGFRFDFRTKNGQTITAREALNRDRDEIFHYLHVVEATPYEQIMQRGLENMGYDFPRWAYTEDPGAENPVLRAQVAEYLSKTWNANIHEGTVYIAPSQATLLEALLRICCSVSKIIGIAGDLDETSEKLFLQTPELRDRVFVGIKKINASLPDIAEHIEHDAPQVLIIKLPRQIMQDSQDLERVLQLAIQKNVLLVFLEEQGSLLDHRGKALMKTFAKYPQALDQSVVIQSLNKTFGLTSLPLAAAVITHLPLYRLLQYYGDASYSRASSATQSLYSQFFAQGEIRNAISGKNLDAAAVMPSSGWTTFTPSPLAQRISQNIVFHTSPQKRAEGSDTTQAPIIDLSFGESEWKPPLEWFEIIQGASSTDPHALYRNAQQAVKQYLEESRRASYTDHEVALGAGVQPLIVSTIRAIQHLHPETTVEVLVPIPSYGIFFPSVEAAGAHLVRVPTSSAERFILTPRSLKAFPRTPGTTRVLLINTPSNPAAQFYRPEEIRILAQATAEEGDYLLVDEVFGLLNLSGTHRIRSLASMEAFQAKHGKRLVTLGGLSKEFALGGLRFGFAASRNMDLMSHMNGTPLNNADPIGLSAAAAVLPQWRSLIPKHIQYLDRRAFALEDFFAARGIFVHRVEGGYTLFADLSPLFSIPHSINGETITPHNFHHLLFQYAGIKIKSDQWAGVPNHFRFAFSIDSMDIALKRLSTFWSLITRT